MRLNTHLLLRTSSSVSVRCAILGVLLVSMLGLSACVSYAPEPLILKEQSTRFLQRGLSDEGLRAFLEKQAGERLGAWPLESWDLSSLTLAAFYFQPALAEARAEWESAAALELDSKRRPNPSLNLGAGYNSTVGIPSPWILTSLLDLTIETGGKRGARRKAAHQDVEIARLHVASVAWTIRDQVRLGMIALTAAIEANKLITERLILQQAYEGQIDKQVEVGLISLAQLTAVKSETEEVRMVAQEVQFKEQSALLSLAAALGLPSDALAGRNIAFESLWSSPKAPLGGGTAEIALFNRAEVLSALADYAKTEADLRLQIANQYPDLSFGPGFEYDQGDHKWSLGTGFSLPIFTRNRNKIAAAEANRRAAAARFDGVQIKVLDEVAQAEAGFRFATQNLAIADSLARTFEQTEQLAASRWQSGDLSKTELMAVQLQMNVRALDRLATKADYLRALGDLENALQSPLGSTLATMQNGTAQDESKANQN